MVDSAAFSIMLNFHSIDVNEQTSPTIFYFMKMSEFSLHNRVNVVVFVNFGDLAFSVYNIFKNYLTSEDAYKICQSGFVSSPISHLSTYNY